MADKLQTFLINIAVIEGRHYVWPNMNSAVLVKIDNQKKCTSVRFNTDNPYYNEYFVFEFYSTLDKLMDKNITVTVIKPGSILRKRQTLGYCTFDVATIWYQTDHQMYHKWAILAAPSSEFVGGTRGYLKLDVSILARGEIPKIPLIPDTDKIEGNLLLPYGTTTERQRVNFTFDVYRGMDFVKKNHLQEGGTKKLEHTSNVSVEIFFSGNNVKTGLRKNLLTPVWNQRLVLPELFPPLAQKFKIELLLGDSGRRAVRYLNLRHISNGKEEGYLPTFGPTFLHFYSPNPLEGYLGKILISLRTQLVYDQEAKNKLFQEAVPFNEDSLLKYEDIIVFAAIFEVSSITKKFGDKPVSFRLGCGPLVADGNDSGDAVSAPVMPPLKPKITNKNLYYLPIEENKPCLHLNLKLPDTRKRMYNYNLLTKMLNQLKKRLDGIEDIFQHINQKATNADITELLLDTLDLTLSAADKYIDIASNYSFAEDTLLDQERQKMSLKEMEAVVLMLKCINTTQTNKKVFWKLEKLYIKIEALIDEVESWPRVYLWMISGNKRVAYHLTKPENIVHSMIEEEKGVHCGALRSVYFQTEETRGDSDFTTAACKMDVLMWMGLHRHWDSFAASFTSCLTLSPDTIPRALSLEGKCEFRCQAYIFQGRFSPGYDKSGLCDPFVQVIIAGQSRQTQILRKTLNPVWDQTLVFRHITLYGCKKFIIENPPTVTVDIYDKDNKFEVMGKAVIKPLIRTIEVCGPIKLVWHQARNKYDVSAEILAAVELLELVSDAQQEEGDEKVIPIPPDIKPRLVNYRVEVVFWGVRNLKKVQLVQVNKPKIVLECASSTLSSDTLINARKNLNFTNPVKILDAVFPEQYEYAPPISLKMFDCRNFGINVFAGTHVTPMWNFFYNPVTEEQRRNMVEEAATIFDFDVDSSLGTIVKNFGEPPKRENKWKKLFHVFKFRSKPVKTEESLTFEQDCDEESDFDWWTKFYASLEERVKQGKIPLRHKHKLKIYPNELELQPEFGGLCDTLCSFPMYKGQRTGDEAVDEENTTGIFKGMFRIYRWPPEDHFTTPSGLPLEEGIFQDFPSNNPLQYVLRVYCVRGLGLRPKDLNGKSDPYLRLVLSDQTISDRNSYIMGQVNPVFGRCFEFKGAFPQEHTLVISVMDWDAATADDLIGETKIDLENRFYTKHRAHCGLADYYMTAGYCQWRDQQKPTGILEGLCKRWNIPEPEYRATSVVVASKEFAPENFSGSDNADDDRQILALAALKRWYQIPVVGCSLVPEHVETRSLYHPHKPGIEQGKLQLWLDILPRGDLPSPKQVNIAPRKPLAYELRIIIWNTEKIRLEENDYFTGGQKSDIFIKGWITHPESSQYTDVHYRSLSGEGNFNWRFIFPFEYISTENKIVLRYKSMFGLEEREEKIPCRLTLQVWDNDTFSVDDFLGVLTLDLPRLPRGAPDYETCNLSLLEPNALVLNLFKTRRTKGWWPFKAFESNKEIFAGAVELEFELLTREDAEKCPAGIGRDEPQALPKPNRPDTSFSWFRNPWKGFKYVAKLHRWRVIKTIVFLLLIFIVFEVIYSLPSYTIKKVLRV